MKPKNLQHGSPDNFQTPPFALDPLLPYIPKTWVVWECAQGIGWLTDALGRQGYHVIGSDILSGQDYRMWEPDKWDVCVTNPPYAIKEQFLERAYMLGKPFAFLLPLTTFETGKRQRLFDEFGLEVIFLDKRINFRTPFNRVSSAWFATAWFTFGLNIGKAMTFAHVVDPGTALPNISIRYTSSDRIEWYDAQST